MIYRSRDKAVPSMFYLYRRRTLAKFKT